MKIVFNVPGGGFQQFGRSFRGKRRRKQQALHFSSSLVFEINELFGRFHALSGDFEIQLMRQRDNRVQNLALSFPDLSNERAIDLQNRKWGNPAAVPTTNVPCRNRRERAECPCRATGLTALPRLHCFP